MSRRKEESSSDDDDDSGDIVSSNNVGSISFLQERLSDELLLHILRYVDANDNEGVQDLVSVGLTCQKLRDLVLDKELCRRMKFTWHIRYMTRSNLPAFITARPRMELVTELDVSDLYWVPSGTLRDAVGKLVNLKVLYFKAKSKQFI
jgi:hypothetical protein